MILQIIVAMKAMPWYCALPTISEYMVERGWTRCFSSISEVGWPAYLGYSIVYLAIIEFGIYWMHRELHDIKPLYKHLHATHHIYNKQNTLSPFAGLAFHSLDGILQAVPHVMALFLIPTHFMTHILLLFIECVWTANIHDCIHGKVWPVMGAGYHTSTTQLTTTTTATTPYRWTGCLERFVTMKRTQRSHLDVRAGLGWYVYDVSLLKGTCLVGMG